MSGSAVDIDWELHPFRVPDAGGSPQIATIREIQAFYEGTIFWGNDWTDPKDAMHFQLASLANGGDIDTFNNPHTADFIARKIRADGFSLFRRGAAPAPPPAADAADVLARATGITLAKAQPIVSQVSFALTKSNCTNPRRIAAALAQWVVESGHFVYTEEIADGPEDQERWKYKGRTWIQLTWLENYLGFSRWCYSLGLVPSPTYFGDRPRELAEQKWAALGPAYWWAVKYPQINEYADRGDIDNVSSGSMPRRGSATQPGMLMARKSAETPTIGRWRLVINYSFWLAQRPPPPEGEDELSAEAERMIRELYDEYQSRRHDPTRSFFATSMLPVESPLGFMLNTDGNVWDMKLTWAYLFGVTRAVEYVERVASEGVSPESWAATVTDEEGHWLTEFGQQYCQGLIGFRDALQAALLSAPGAPTPPLPPPQPQPAGVSCGVVTIPAAGDPQRCPRPTHPSAPSPGERISTADRRWSQRFG